MDLRSRNRLAGVPHGWTLVEAESSLRVWRFEVGMTQSVQLAAEADQWEGRVHQRDGAQWRQHHGRHRGPAGGRQSQQR